MAKVRKFTDEVREALKEGVCDDGFWAGIGDWVKDGGQHVKDFFCGDVELEDDMSNLNTYLDYVADIHDYTDDYIEELFKTVNTVDWSYRIILSNSNDCVDSYIKMINRLTECISQTNFKENFSQDAFLNDTDVESDSLKLMGVKWKTILEKDADEISDAEYLIIARYAVELGDEQVFEEMLTCCYSEIGYEQDPLFDNPGAIRYYEYESNGKIEKFTGALYIIKEEYNDQVLNKENEEQSDKDDIFGRAIQMYEISSDLNNSGNIYLQKDKGEPLGKLIELNYKDEDKEWYLSYSPEKNDMMRVVVFKEVSQNGDAQLKLVNDSYKYLGVTDQDPLSESLNSIGETVAEDFLVSCIQATPVLGDKLKTVYDVTSKAIDAIDPYTEAKKNKEAVEIGELGTLVDFFDLMVVPVDVESSGKEGDEDDSGYSYSLYKTSSTQDRIDEFNNYMENNPLEAKFFEYDKLPDGKLTLDYIIDNPEDVEEMVSWYMDQCGTASTSSEELISGQGDEEINSETE